MQNRCVTNNCSIHVGLRSSFLHYSNQGLLALTKQICIPYAQQARIIYWYAVYKQKIVLELFYVGTFSHLSTTAKIRINITHSIFGSLEGEAINRVIRIKKGVLGFVKTSMMKTAEIGLPINLQFKLQL